MSTQENNAQYWADAVRENPTAIKNSLVNVLCQAFENVPDVTIDAHDVSNINMLHRMLSEMEPE